MCLGAEFRIFTVSGQLRQFEIKQKQFNFLDVQILDLRKMAQITEIKDCYSMRFRIHRCLNMENMDPAVHEIVEDKFISLLVVNFQRSPLTMENLQSLALSVPSLYWRLTGEELDPSLLRIAPARLQVVHHGAETGDQHGDGESPAEEEDHYGQELPSPSTRREASPAAPASTTEDANGLPEALPLAWGEDEPSSPSSSVASDTQPGSQVEPEHAEPSSSTFWIPAGPNSMWQQVEIEGHSYLRKLDELSIPEGLWSITDYADDHTVVMSVHVSVRVSVSLRTWGVRQEDRPPHRPAGTSQRKRKAEPDDSSSSSSPPSRKRPMRL